MGFPGGSDGKKSTCNVGGPGLLPGLGRSPGEGNGNPLQYSCLENSTDRRAWWATVHGVKIDRHDWATNTFTFTFPSVLETCWNNSFLICISVCPYHLARGTASSNVVFKRTDSPFPIITLLIGREMSMCYVGPFSQSLLICKLFFFILISQIGTGFLDSL